MKKILFVLLMVMMFLPKEVYAKAYFATKNEMIEKADIIAVVDITKVETVEVKGDHWDYRQRATAKVEQLIKGKIPQQVYIYGMESFICAQCHYEVGRFLLFLQYDKKLLRGSNWQFSIRPIKEDKVEWYKNGGDDRFDLESLPLSPVLQEIKDKIKQLLCLNSYAGDAEDLISAAWDGDISTVKELLAKGADMNAKADDGIGRTALMFASAVGHLEVVQALLSKGADVNVKDNYGLTVLMYASNTGNLEIVQALIAKGADVNAKSDANETALMEASMKGHLDVVQILLAKSADVNTKTNDGETALSLAKAKGHSDIAKLLIKAGAKE